MMTTKADPRWMRRAIELALRAEGRTAPNPVVGSVIVRDGEVVGEGWHVRAGEPHGEAMALAKAGDAAQGADVYVTLEPCSFQGRTPSCAKALIEAGVRRVIAAVEDPNPRVAGSGFQLLREAGIEVESGVLAEDAQRVNEPYLFRARTGRAFGVLKAAVTLDGRLATETGDSRWLTGALARKRAHELRDRYDAVVIGRGTLDADDPSLDVRLGEEDGHPRRDPAVIVVDSHLRGKADRALWKRAAAGARVIVATTESASAEQATALTEQGVHVWIVAAGVDGRVDVKALFVKIAEEGLNSAMVEGGGELHTSCLAAGLYGRAYIFVSPRILGGAQGPRLVEDLGVDTVANGFRLDEVEHETLGPDVLISGRIVRGGGDL